MQHISLLNLKHPQTILACFILIVIAALGAWTRWLYIQTGVFQIDEFISMLAIRMILEKGQPILPSGLYYDHGLVFTYLGAIVASLAKGDMLAVRWWSLIAGVLAIIAIWLTSWRLYGSPWWGLFPALYLALEPEAIQWGGRVRMYSQADLIVILWILLAWVGTLDGGRRWARWLLIALIWVGLNTHLVLLLVLPPLACGLFITWLFSNHFASSFFNRKKKTVEQVANLSSSPSSEPSRQKPITTSVIIDLALAVIVVIVAFWGGQQSFVASYTVDSSIPDTETEAINANPVGDVIVFELNETRWHEMERYLNDGVLRYFSALALVGLAAVGIAFIRGRPQQADLGGLFISLMLVSLILGMLLFVADTWHQLRYYFLVIFPLILLLAAYGIRAIFNSTVWLAYKLKINRVPLTRLAGVTVVLIVSVIWPGWALGRGAMEVISGSTDTPNRYQLAFEVVNTSRAPADQIATIRPEAAYLFSGSLDYYVNHGSPVLIPGDGEWLDGYTGATYLDDVWALRQALAEPGMLWLVIDDERLYKRLEPIFAQYILWHMDVVQTIDNVLVLREGDSPPLPYPAETTPPLAILISNIELVDYAIAGGIGSEQFINLTTFWRNTRTLWLFKIFVHIRDQDGNTIAQADFTPLEQIDEKLHEAMLGQSSTDVIPLNTTLAIPPNLPPGEYSLYVGVYHPVALERVPVVNDQSGENAILLGVFEVGAAVAHQ